MPISIGRLPSLRDERGVSSEPVTSFPSRISSRDFARQAIARHVAINTRKARRTHIKTVWALDCRMRAPRLRSPLVEPEGIGPDRPD